MAEQNDDFNKNVQAEIKRNQQHLEEVRQSFTTGYRVAGFDLNLISSSLEKLAEALHKEHEDLQKAEAGHCKLLQE